jgi:hypothetical protein
MWSEHSYHLVDAANANAFGFSGRVIGFWDKISIENIGNPVADAIHTEWHTSHISVTGPSEEVEEVGEEVLEWKGDGGESGGDGYCMPDGGVVGLAGLQGGTCCNF